MSSTTANPIATQPAYTMPSVTLSTSRRRTAHTMPSALAPSSTNGADPIIAASSPNTTATIELTTAAAMMATQAPHNRACTLDDRGSGSTRSSHDNTGSTISSGTSPATTAHGELTPITSSIRAVSTPHTTTGGLKKRGSRGRRPDSASSDDLPEPVNPVHDVPSNQRQAVTPNGSGYQPAAATVRSAAGAGNGPGGDCPVTVRPRRTPACGTTSGRHRRRGRRRPGRPGAAAQPSCRQSGSPPERTCDAHADES